MLILHRACFSLTQHTDLYLHTAYGVLLASSGRMEVTFSMVPYSMASPSV